MSWDASSFWEDLRAWAQLIEMALTFEERKIAIFEDGRVRVSTVEVSDSNCPFETGVAHPGYGGGRIVVVEQYNNHVDAQRGHDMWVMLMTADTPPDSLLDVSESGTSRLRDQVTGSRDWRVFPYQGE